MAIYILFSVLIGIIYVFLSYLLASGPCEARGLREVFCFSVKPISHCCNEKSSFLPWGTGSWLSCCPLRTLCLPHTALPAAAPALCQACAEQAGEGEAPSWWKMLLHRCPGSALTELPACSRSPPFFPCGILPLHAEVTRVPSVPLAPHISQYLKQASQEVWKLLWFAFMVSRRNGVIHLWAVSYSLQTQTSSVFPFKISKLWS